MEMELLKHLIDLATERSTKRVSEQIIKMERLAISLQKLITSFNEGASAPEAPQKVHIQAIENIFYQDPQLFDNFLMDKFFSLKNDLDPGIITIPFNKLEHKAIFSEILESVVAIKIKLHKRERIVYKFKWGAFIIIGIALLIILAVKVKSSFIELFFTQSQPITQQKNTE